MRDPGRYQLERVAGPAVEPLTVAEAKRYLRVEDDFADDDDLIADLIAAARELCETRTDRTFLATRWRLTLDGAEAGRFAGWAGPGPGRGYGPGPGDEPGAIRLPRPPLLAVESVEWTGGAGPIAIDPGDYLATPGTPGTVEPGAGLVVPPSLGIAGPVAITFAAGYGPDASDLPAAARLAVRMLVAFFYDRRATADEVPPAVDRVLDRLRWGAYA